MEINTFGRIQTVTDITKSIKGLLETGFAFIAVTGEISNLRMPASGHMYFTLKDAESQLKAVMFKMQRRYLDEVPKDGMQVICRGRISVYEPRGEYQCVVDTMEFHGKGSLHEAFERLKSKLAVEGLFAMERKRALPRFPQRIAVITSPQGAAIRDFIKVSRSRFPMTQIDIYPVRVQGDAAPAEITAAISEINAETAADIIVICRGGGSIEDLWAFNNETLARTIAASNIPTVSAIGHETDFTITDFVSDFRAPTPSAAAEAVLPDKKQINEKISYAGKRLISWMTESLSKHRSRLELSGKMLKDPTSTLEHFYLRVDHARISLQHLISQSTGNAKKMLFPLANRLSRHSPEKMLNVSRHRLTECIQQLNHLMSKGIEQRTASLQKSAALLDSVSPLAILARGYSITRIAEHGKTIKNSRDVRIGDMVDVILHQGELTCEVKGISQEIS